MKQAVKWFAVFTVICSMMVSGGCSANGKRAEETGNQVDVPKIGVIVGVGGLGDGSFNDLAYNGTQMFEPGEVQVDLAEPKQVSDFQMLQQQFAESEEYAAIVCVGYDQSEALAEVAANFPEQKFILVDASVDNQNVASVNIENQQNGFQMGAFAALVEEEGKLEGSREDLHIGVVAAMDIPLIRTFVSGYICGARYINPDIQVDVSYVGSFNDPQTAKEIALSMYENGADIVWQAAGGSGLGVFEAAKTSGLYALGADGNQNVISPDRILASSIRRADKIVYKLCKAAIDGTFEGGPDVYGAADEAVEIVTEGSQVQISPEVMETVSELTQMMADGRLIVPNTMEEIDGFIQEYGRYGQ